MSSCYTPLDRMSPNAFLSSIARKFESMGRFEDPELHKIVLADVPVILLEQKAQERMRELQKKVRQDGTDINISIQELILLEVLTWFKTWMQWVDSPECDECDGETKFSHCSSDICLLRSSGADRIEIFRCVLPQCGYMTHFERHSDPGKAWLSRRGRCGEFAAAFTILCRALKWEARLISDSTDHAWTEVYSMAQNRWLHCDPCENICDQPLIYETGWGKQLAYIIAYSHHDLQDVTWRYSANHSAVRGNRTACSEIDLLSLIVNLRELKQSRLSFARRKYLVRRTVLELVELMVEKRITEDDKQGRTSGSLSWRLERGETKIEERKTWVATPDDEMANSMTIRYSPIHDRYERISQGKVIETLNKWKSGVFGCEGVFRKEEKDWKMVYLCREESSNEGKIQWRFSAGHGKRVHKVSIRLDSKTYENGEILLTVTGNDKTIDFTNAGALDTVELSGADAITVVARLTGGRGDCAWQHAQLCRQPLAHATDFPFSVTVTFH